MPKMSKGENTMNIKEINKILGEKYNATGQMICWKYYFFKTLFAYLFLKNGTKEKT